MQEETDWKPRGGLCEYNGNSVYFHNIGPSELRTGEVDGDIEFDEEVHEKANTD